MNHAFEKLGAAYHEASHAVVAILLGATVKNVNLEREDNEWIGNAEVTWSEPAGPARKLKIIEVAAAGGFGQAKYRASNAWGKVQFDANDGFSAAIRIIRQGELTDDSTLGFDFRSDDGLTHQLIVRDFNDIGDLEELRDFSAEFDETALSRLLAGLAGKLDNPKAWDSIGKHATSLCQQHRITNVEIA